MWGAAVAFFGVNVWLLGIILGDIKDRRVRREKRVD
jgi:hypothetical protein